MQVYLLVLLFVLMRGCLWLVVCGVVVVNLYFCIELDYDARVLGVTCSFVFSCFVEF